MPSPSPFSSLAAKLLRQQLLHPPLPSSSSSSSSLAALAAGGRCFASKAGKDKDKGKAKSGGSEKDPPPPAAAAEKKASSKKPHWSQQVFYKVSARLVPVLDCKEATRPEAIERLWDYIKSNNLQVRLLLPFFHMVGKSTLHFSHCALGYVRRVHSTFSFFIVSLSI
jgi:hypothetical protein